MKNFFLRRLEENSSTIGNVVAIKYLNESITYEQLEYQTDLLARWICEYISFDEKKPIILYHSRGIQFVKYVIAIMKSNCYYIPIESKIPESRLKYIYKDVNAILIISDYEISDRKGMNICNADFDYNLIDYSKIYNCNYKTNFDNNDLVYVMYTSGTTGKPKGVKIKYLNLENLVQSFEKIIYSKFVHNVNIGVLASFSFDSSVKQLFCALYYGHTLVIAEEKVRYFGSKIHKFHNENNLMLCDATPSHLRIMVMQGNKCRSNIRYIIVGGENLSWKIIEEYKRAINMNCIFVNVYGPTECCVDVSYNIIEYKEENYGMVPIGHPLNNTEIVIVDESENVISKPNCEGEIYVFGRQVGDGYIGFESSNFIKDSNNIIVGYKTGDLAIYNENMEIVVVSRKDRQVKINGFRIELEEISSAISSYTECQCYVSLIKKNKSSVLVAFINGKFSKEKLLKELRKNLISYMVPKILIEVNELPITERGKIDEEELYSLLLQYD